MQFELDFQIMFFVENIFVDKSNSNSFEYCFSTNLSNYTNFIHFTKCHLLLVKWINKTSCFMKNIHVTKIYQINKQWQQENLVFLSNVFNENVKKEQKKTK